MKNKIVTILLLLSFVTPITVTYIWLNYQKINLKQEVNLKIQSGLDKERLVLLKFKSNKVEKQLKWKHSKEFELNGEMYDIVEKEIYGDTTYFWCYSDTGETQLNKKFEEFFSNIFDNISQTQDTPKWLTKIFKSLYYDEIVINLNIFQRIIQVNSNYCFSFINFISSPPKPPPEIV